MKRLLILAVLAALALPSSALATLSVLDGAVQKSDGTYCSSGCRMYYKNNTTNGVSYIGAGALNQLEDQEFLSYPNGNIYTFYLNIWLNAWVTKSDDYSFNIWGWQACPTGGGAHLSPVITMGPGYGAYKGSPWWTGNLHLQPGCLTG